MKLKLRPQLALRNITNGDTVVQQSAYAISVLVRGRWTLLGNDDGPMYFETPEERNQVMEKFQGREVEAQP